jgi:hypothetical protein
MAEPVEHSPQVRAWLDTQPQQPTGPAFVFAQAMRAEDAADRAEDRVRSKRAEDARERAEQVADMARLGLGPELHTHDDVMMQALLVSEVEDAQGDRVRQRQLEARAIQAEERIIALQAELARERQRSMRSLSQANQAAAAYRAQVYGAQPAYRSNDVYWR